MFLGREEEDAPRAFELGRSWAAPLARMREPRCSSEFLPGSDHTAAPWFSQCRPTQCVSGAGGLLGSERLGAACTWISPCLASPWGRFSSSYSRIRSVVSAYSWDHDPAPLKKQGKRLPWWPGGGPLHTPNAGGTVSIPGWGPKISRAAQYGLKKNKEEVGCSVGRAL